MSKEGRGMSERKTHARKAMRDEKDSGSTVAEMEPVRIPFPDPAAIHALRTGEHGNPHAILGAHPLSPDSDRGIVIRAMHPSAASVECILRDGGVLPMEPFDIGFWHVAVPDARFPVHYRLRFRFDDGSTWEIGRASCR